MFKTTRYTPQIKKQIALALVENNIPPTVKNVETVYHNHMVQCGAETDMCDALAASFGGSLDDYGFERKNDGKPDVTFINK
jgi:hypothetical protein